MALAGWLQSLGAIGRSREETQAAAPPKRPVNPMPKAAVAQVKTQRGAKSSFIDAYKDTIRSAQQSMTSGNAKAPKKLAQEVASRTGKRSSWVQQALSPTNFTGIEFANTMLDWQKARTEEGKSGTVEGALQDPRLWWGGGGTPSTMDINTSAPARQGISMIDSLIPVANFVDPQGVMRSSGRAWDQMQEQAKKHAPAIYNSPVFEFQRNLDEGVGQAVGAPTAYMRKMLGTGRIEAPTYHSVNQKAQLYNEQAGTEIPPGLGASTTRLREVVPGMDNLLEAGNVQKDDPAALKALKYGTTAQRIGAGFIGGLSPSNTVGFVHDVAGDAKSWITAGASTGTQIASKAILQKAATEGLEAAAVKVAREGAEAVAREGAEAVAREGGEAVVEKAAKAVLPTLDDIGEHSLARISEAKGGPVNLIDDVVEAMSDPQFLREQAEVFPDLAEKLVAKANAIEAGESARLSVASETGRDLMGRIGVRARESIKAWVAQSRGETTGAGVEIPLIGKRLAGMRGQAEEVLDASLAGDVVPTAVSNVLNQRRAVAGMLSGKIGTPLRAGMSSAERFAENPAQTAALQALDLARRHGPNLARATAATHLDAIQTAAGVDELDRAAMMRNAGGIAGEDDTAAVSMLNELTQQTTKQRKAAEQAVDYYDMTPQKAEATVGTADYKAGVADERVSEAQAAVAAIDQQADELLAGLGLGKSVPRTSRGLEGAAQRARAEARGTKRAVREADTGLAQTADDLERAADREARALGQYDELKTANEPGAVAPATKRRIDLFGEPVGETPTLGKIGRTRGEGFDVIRTKGPHGVVEVRVADDASEPIILSDIVVAEKKRGQGYGTKMLTEMEEWLGDTYGERAVWLETPKYLDVNETIALQEFYEKRGWEIADYGEMTKVVGQGKAARGIRPIVENPATMAEAAGVAPEAARTVGKTTATGKGQTFRTWQRSVEESLKGASPAEQTHRAKTKLSKSGTAKGTTAVRMDAQDLADNEPELVMDILEGRVNAALDAGDIVAARKHQAVYDDFVEDFGTKTDEVPDWLKGDKWWDPDETLTELPRTPARPDLEAATAFDPEAAAAARAAAVEQAQKRANSTRARLERSYREGRATGAAEQARQAASDAVRAERRAAATEGRKADYLGVIASRETKAEKLQAAADALRAIERDGAKAAGRAKTAAKRAAKTIADRDLLDDVVREREAAAGAESLAREMEQKFRATLKPDPTLVANDLRENAYRAAIRDKLEPTIRKKFAGQDIDEEKLAAAIDAEVEAYWANTVTPERVERATYALLGYDLAPADVREAALKRMADSTWRDADDAMSAVLGGLRGEYQRVYQEGVEQGVRDPANAHDEILKGLYQHFSVKDSATTVRGAFANQVGGSTIDAIEGIPVVGKKIAQNLREKGSEESVIRQVADDAQRPIGPDASESTDLLSEMARHSKTWDDYNKAVSGLAETDAFTAMARYAEESARSYGRARFAVDGAKKFGVPIHGEITVPPFMRVYSLSDEQLIEQAAATGKVQVPKGETWYMMPDQIGRFMTSRGSTIPRSAQALYNNLNAVTNFFKTWAAPMSVGFSIRNWTGGKWQLYLKDGISALDPTADLEAWRFTIGAMFPSLRERLAWDAGTVVDALGNKRTYKEVWDEMSDRGLTDAGMVQQQLGGAVSQRLKGKQVAAEGTNAEKLAFGWKTGRLDPTKQEFVVYDKARGMAGAVEVQQRAQSFLHDLRAHGDPDAAAIGARRYLFDYGDNTAMVGTWGKIMFPFISWSKNNIPLQFAEALQRPGRFAAYKHATDWFEGTSPDEPLADRNTPDYIERQGGLRTSLKDENGKPVYVLTPFGIGDLNKVPYPSIDSRFTVGQNIRRTGQNVTQTLADEWYPMTNWLIRAIPDIVRGETQTGQKIENVPAYLFQSAMPVAARATRILNPALGERLGFGKEEMTPYAATSLSTGLRTYPVDYEKEASGQLYEQAEEWKTMRERLYKQGGLDPRYGIPVE